MPVEIVYVVSTVQCIFHAGLGPGRPVARLARFLGDVANLESDYIAILRSLAYSGTRVVRYRDDQRLGRAL